MPVTFVAGSDATFATGTGAISVSGTTPAGIQDNDTLLAAVFAYGTITTPSGWQKIAEVGPYDSWDPAEDVLYIPALLAVFSKTTVTSANSSTSYTWSIDTESTIEDTRIGVAYQVWRGVDAISTATGSSSQVDAWTISAPVVTSTVNDTGIAMFANSVLQNQSVTPTVPASSTRTTQATASNDYRLSASQRIVAASTSNSGSFNFGPGVDPPVTEIGYENGLGAITLRLTPSGAIADADVRISSPGPLGVPTIQALRTEPVRISVPGILSYASSFTVNDDFHPLINGRPVTAHMTLTLPDTSVVSVPISNWQATLQTQGQSYLRCTIPAPEPYLEQLTDAVSFTVKIATTTIYGEVVERVIGTVTDITFQSDQGASSFSAQLGGYFAAFPVRPDPDPAFYRPATGIQTVSQSATSSRVRCYPDWIAVPSDWFTYLDGAGEFKSGYMNLYFTDGLFYMDVGTSSI